MTPPRNEEEISSVGRVIDATLPQANLDVTSSLTNLSSVSPNFSNLCVSPKAAVTTNDIARGYAFVEARTNATVSYAMPTNGVVAGTWDRTGTFEDVVRVELVTGQEESGSGETPLPLWGDVCVTSLWAYTWGKVRPRLRDRAHEIVAVGAPMSCVPGEGRLWTATTTNGTWLITWESFRAGREIFNAENEESQRRGEEDSQNGRAESMTPPDEDDDISSVGRVIDATLPLTNLSSATSNDSVLRAKNTDPISAQIEFFSNGDFITRSNDVERVYRRVNPDDWDDDGISNEIDDDPLVAADSPQFGPYQDLSVVEHEENYCWIDIVVPQANAKVMFAGEGASNLADPSFIAKAGETNRVTLLIGKPYHATCAFPFEIVGQSSVSIESCFDDDNRAADICWPVKISVVGQNASNAANAVSLASDVASVNASVGASASTASFTMSVDPACLDGVFAWTNVCCSISGGAFSFSYSCRSSCPCTGCSSSGYYVYEGYRIGCVGGTCGCLPSGGPPHEPASVSVSFSKNAIIFEDAYEASEGVTIARRSTETVLSCSASGGGRGGFLYVSLEGADKLALYGGQSLPYSKALAANETISFTCRYRAVKASDAEGDIKVTATFAENETGTKQSAEATATAIQIEVTPFAEAPQNKSMGRHKYGVCEDVVCRQSPSAPVVTWVADKGAVEVTETVYHCPIQAAANPLSASCGGAEYVPQITVVEPDEVKVRNPDCSDLGATAGEAGSLVLLLPLYIGPFDVAFYGIAVEEVPYDDAPWSGDTHTGYFSRSDLVTWWHHTRENGAGEWLDVEEENHLGGEGAHDFAGMTRTLSRVTDSGLFVDDPSCRWADGVISFGTPFGWNKRGTTGNAAPCSRFAEDVRAEFVLLEDGTFTVRKLGNEATRYVDGRVFLNGEQKK